jgi:hypothetical protein
MFEKIFEIQQLEEKARLYVRKVNAIQERLTKLEMKVAAIECEKDFQKSENTANHLISYEYEIDELRESYKSLQEEIYLLRKREYLIMSVFCAMSALTLGLCFYGIFL